MQNDIARDERTFRSPIRLLAVALVAAGVLFAAIDLVAPGTALAHARYKSSTPAKAEVVQTSPAAVEIVFTEDIQKVAGTYDITVNRDRGASVATGAAVVDNDDRSKLSVPLQPNLQPGRYVVEWKNVSDDDGDPANGAFSFYVGTPPTTVDLTNDQQLEQVGAEEENTATAEVTAAVTVAPATRAVATPIATAAASNSGGDSNTGLYVGIGVVVAVVIVAAGAWFVFARRTA